MDQAADVRAVTELSGAIVTLLGKNANRLDCTDYGDNLVEERADLSPPGLNAFANWREVREGGPAR